MWWIDRGGRVERVKSTINQKTNWNWLSYRPQYYTALLLSYYIVISAFHITFPEENKKEWTRQLNTAEPKTFSHIKVWSLCLVRRGKKQKQLFFFLIKQCRIHFILSAFNKEQANDLSFCAALHKCSHQKMKDRFYKKCSWAMTLHCDKDLKRFQTLCKEPYSYLSGIINNYSTLN